MFSKPLKKDLVRTAPSSNLSSNVSWNWPFGLELSWICWWARPVVDCKRTVFSLVRWSLGSPKLGAFIVPHGSPAWASIGQRMTLYHC